MKKLNWLDWTVIVVVILAASLYGYKRFSPSGTALPEKKTVKVQFEVEFTKRDIGFASLIQEGHEVQISEKEKDIAEVKAVTAAPAKRIEEDAVNGTYVSALIPDKEDVCVTVEGIGIETESEITIGATPIRVGDEMAIKGKGYAGYGFILNSKVIE